MPREIALKLIASLNEQMRIMSSLARKNGYTPEDIEQMTAAARRSLAEAVTDLGGIDISGHAPC